jgi:thiamine-phosphate pyrophosphorylase
LEAYLVTDRRLASDEFLLRLIRAAAEAGVDRIQIREKDLMGRALMRLTRQAMEALEGSKATLLVNDRVDVAVAAGAHGAHLGLSSMPMELARRAAGEDLILGASTHSLEEALQAQESGADYLFVGPVFPTASKAAFGEPLGVPKLETILRRIKIPAYAIGGVTPERLAILRGLPLTGVAMISGFVRAPSVQELVQQIHGSRWG